MPFKSEKQRRYMHANLPDIAKRWEKDYASGGIARVGYQQGMGVAPYPNPILTNMQRMKPLALDVMTGQHQPGISPHRGGYGPIDPYGNIQMGLEKENFYQSPQGLAFLRNKMGNMFSGATNTMGNMFTGAKDAVSGIFSGAKNQGGALLGNIMGMAMGIPGLGALLGNMRPDNPYEKFQKQMFSDMYGGHDFGNKDPFGKNIRSLFGEYDVIEQADKFAASKLGQKRNFAEVMADGIITQNEIDEYGLDKMGGYQLNRLRTLAAAKKKAQAYQKKIADAQTLKEKQREERKRKDTTPTYKGTPGGNTGSGSFATFDNTGKTYGPHGGSTSSPKGYSARSHSGGNYGGRHHWSQGGIVSLWQK